MSHSYNIRIQMGLTQREFAALLGVSQGTINHAETGKKPLPDDAQRKMRLIQERLERNLQAPDEPLALAIKKEKEKLITALELECAEMEIKRIHLNRTLKKMIAKHAELEKPVFIFTSEKRIYAHLPLLFTDVQADYDKIIKAFAPNAPECQQIIVFQIEVLDQALAMLRAKILELK